MPWAFGWEIGPSPPTWGGAKPAWVCPMCWACPTCLGLSHLPGSVLSAWACPTCLGPPYLLGLSHLPGPCEALGQEGGAQGVCGQSVCCPGSPSASWGSPQAASCRKCQD